MPFSFFILFLNNKLTLNYLGKGHALLDLCNGKTRVKALRTGSRTVHNSMTSVNAHGVLETLTTSSASLITRINHPSESLHENGRTKVLSRVPPVRGARSRATGTENAFIETIKLLAVLNGLQVFTTVSRNRLTLEVRLNRLVLLVKLSQIWNQVTDNKHVR